MTTPDIPLPAPGDPDWNDWAAEQEAVTDEARVGGTATASAASQMVQASKVTGDVTNRYERRADGSTAIGPGGSTALRNTEAFSVIDLGNEPTRHGIVIYGSSNATPGSQLMVLFDHLGAPIFTVPVAGGPSVLGDNFRIFAGGEVFSHEVSLRLDGTVQARKGDPAGGAGVLALGAATTAPTRNPDGSVDLDGSDTIAGMVLWTDSNGRTRIRRASGPIDVIGGNPSATTAPTTGLVQGDTYYNSTSRRVHYHDGGAWPRLGLAQTPLASYHPKVGEYLTAAWFASAGTFTPNASEMVLVPIDVSEWGATYDRVGVRVVGAGVGGTPQARFGLYADDGTGAAPTGAPLNDWGLTGAQTAANTESLITVSWTPPRLGRFWLAVAYQPTGTVTTAPTYAITGGQSLPTTNLDPTYSIRALTQTGVTGALPTIGTLGKSGAGYQVGLRRSA